MSYILIIHIVIMAVVTYLIRVIPMVVFRKKIDNGFIRSFLSYVPYAVLSAMTFPAILKSTGTVSSAVVGCSVAVVMAYRGRGLLTVALGAGAAVFLVQIVGL